MASGVWVGSRRICRLGWCRMCGLDGGGFVGWDGVGHVSWAVQDVWVEWRRTCRLGQPHCCSSGSAQVVDTALELLCFAVTSLCQVTSLGATVPQATTRRLGLAMCPREEMCCPPQDQEDCPRALLVSSRSLQTVAEFPLPSGRTGTQALSCAFDIFWD